LIGLWPHDEIKRLGVIDADASQQPASTPRRASLSDEDPKPDLHILLIGGANGHWSIVDAGARVFA